jgi:hypothetical protein
MFLTRELALFRREAVDGNRVTGVMRAVVEDNLNITYIIKTALVRFPQYPLIEATVRYDFDDHDKEDIRRLPIPPGLVAI